MWILYRHTISASSLTTATCDLVYNSFHFPSRQQCKQTELQCIGCFIEIARHFTWVHKIKNGMYLHLHLIPPTIKTHHLYTKPGSPTWNPKCIWLTLAMHKYVQCYSLSDISHARFCHLSWKSERWKYAQCAYNIWLFANALPDDEWHDDDSRMHTQNGLHIITYVWTCLFVWNLNRYPKHEMWRNIN